MWNEILNNGGILALAGVVIGFLLSEISGAYKKHREREDSKVALLDEVRFNHEQTINKIDILNQAIDALKKERFLSTKCAKYSTTEFESLYPLALPKLTRLQRDNLRHLNSFYITIDKLLDSFDESFKNDIDNAEIRRNTIESVYQAAIIQLENIKNSLSASLELSSRLLEGNPLPIFNSEKA
ncbi:hypothetical protein [Rhodocaloribacter sp.]